MVSLCLSLLTLSVIPYIGIADKEKPASYWVKHCTEHLIFEIFDKDSKGDTCSKDEINTLPEFLQPKHHDNPINSIDFLSYALFPQGMDNFIRTQREFSETFKKTIDRVGETSVQYWLGTKDEGRTLLIFFPGTANIPDVKIDISVKHVPVELPLMVSDEYKTKDTFRIHQGIHSRINDYEIQRGIQEDLLFLYSGDKKMAPVRWKPWIKEQKIDKDTEEKLIKCGFRQKIEGKDVFYTIPEAMDLQSEHWEEFVNHPNVTKKQIVAVSNGIDHITQKILKHARRGIKTEKVENLIISGHSLGGGYAPIFFLRLYGILSERKLPGYHLLPDDINKVTVIPIAGPSVVYNEDAKKIKDVALGRITNLWNYDDPVPIIMNGFEKVTKENIKLGFKALIQYAKDLALISLGTNQPIGNVIVLMYGQKRILMPKEEKKEKGFKGKLNEFGKKIGAGKLFGGRTDFKKTKEKKVWFKVLSYKDVKKGYLEHHDTTRRRLGGLDDSFYANNGCKCLWKRTYGGILGAVGGALQHHMLNKYRERIYNSCLKNYLLSKSKYWKEFADEAAADDIEKNKFKHTVKKLAIKTVGKVFDLVTPDIVGKPLKYLGGKIVDKVRSSAVENEENEYLDYGEYRNYEYYDNEEFVDDVEDENYVDLFGNNDNNKVYGEEWMMVLLIASMLGIVVCSFVFGLICGFIFALIRKE